MKVKYRTETVKQVEYCCEEMKKAEEARAIVFPVSADLGSGWIFGPHNPKLGGAPRPFEIRYCPFCGQRIVFEEVKT
jgi:hypothetical protein